MSSKRWCVCNEFSSFGLVFCANRLAGRPSPRRVLVRALPQTSGSVLQDSCAIVVGCSMCLKPWTICSPRQQYSPVGAYRETTRVRGLK